MKASKYIVRVLFLSVLVGLFGCSGGLQEKPTLVVYVVVDQLRGDLLERYDSLFTGGIRRLHDGGFRFLSATHDHAKTSTAAGHATLSTGVFPVPERDRRERLVGADGRGLAVRLFS